jgi:hypothetical protein
MFELDAVAAFVPNARIMFALREPASRALSIAAYRRADEGLPVQTAAELTTLYDGVMNDLWNESLCLAPGIPFNEASLSALLEAAQLQQRGPNHLRCMQGQIVPCRRVARINGSGARAFENSNGLSYAVLPLYVRSASAGAEILQSFYLGPLLHASALFGPSSVHVHWLETLKSDAPSVLQNITRFLGVHELSAPPVGEVGLDVVRKQLRPVTEVPYNRSELATLEVVSGNLTTVFAWENSNARAHAERNSSAGHRVEVLRRLQHFFAPYERVRRAYFALHGLPELPWESDPRRNVTE